MTITALSRATATQYRLVLNQIPIPISAGSLHDMDELKLNIFSVVLPSITLDQSQMDWQGKHTYLHHGGVTFDPLNISFVVDSRFANWKILFTWLTSIANNKDRPTRPPDEYVTDAAIILMDNWDQTLFKLVFKNLWIQSLGELSFSIRDGETHIECTAIFYYDRYELDQTI